MKYLICFFLTVLYNESVSYKKCVCVINSFTIKVQKEGMNYHNNIYMLQPRNNELIHFVLICIPMHICYDLKKESAVVNVAFYGEKDSDF